MAVKKYEVKAFKEVLYCDNCEGVEMTMNETVLLTMPPGYTYTCGNCHGVVSIQGEIYPRITYEEVSDDTD